MKLNKKIIKLITMSSILFSITTNCYADSKKEVSIDPIFTSQDGVWYPGRVESRNFYISNNTKNNIIIDKLYIKLDSAKDLNTNQTLDINSSEFKQWSKHSKVTLKYGNQILFDSSLDGFLSGKSLLDKKEIYIKSNDKVLLNMTIDMHKDMENEAQHIENIFNISVAYKGDQGNPEPPIDPGNPEPPVYPDNPGPPIDPGNPEPPVYPDNPGPPIDPGNPEPPINPGDPELPVNPDKPIDPSNPELPVNPDTGIGGVDKLPQTGGMVNGASLLALGSIVVGTGIMLNKKSSDEKGGKHDE